jgi:hypothetical protein
VITTTTDVSAEEFASGTGWKINPEGACKGEICGPLPDGYSAAHASDRLGMAVVKDDASGLVAFGPESLNSRALVTAEAPDVVLPDLDGNEFQLSSLRGKKVVVVAWAPY